MKTYEVKWLEFTKSGGQTGKRKEFKTAEARSKFVDKLVEKDNFYQILAYSD